MNELRQPPRSKRWQYVSGIFGVATALGGAAMAIGALPITLLVSSGIAIGAIVSVVAAKMHYSGENVPAEPNEQRRDPGAFRRVPNEVARDSLRRRRRVVQRNERSEELQKQQLEMARRIEDSETPDLGQAFDHYIEAATLGSEDALLTPVRSF